MPYYYAQMDKPRQEAYHAMLTGLQAPSPAFPVPRLEGEVLAEVFFQLRLDRPELFYAPSFTYRYHPDGVRVECRPDYLFDKAKIRDHQKAMAARVEKLCRPARELGEWEQVRCIHDFICQNVRYDKLKKAYSHEIIGPLGQGVGVCEGIAKAVKVLCDGLGLWCAIAVAEAAPEKGVRYRHAWNVLRLGGRHYHLDATFDGSLSRDGVVRYDYFALDDRHIFRDHQPLVWPVPPCTDGDRAYYRAQKRSFTKYEEVTKWAVQTARKKGTLVFQWRGGPLTREVLGELVALLEEAARQKGRHARVGLNWSQAVLQVSFPEEMPQQACTAQQADEGADPASDRPL